MLLMCPQMSTTAGFCANDVALEARAHLTGLLAADAAIDDVKSGQDRIAPATGVGRAENDHLLGRGRRVRIVRHQHS